MKKHVFYTEAAYAAGLILIALSAALMAAADFGVSMVVAPAYIIYLKVSQLLPFFTFGMAEYLLQAVILAVMLLLLRRFRISYLFSFVTAVLYGFILDAAMLLTSLLPVEYFPVRVIMFVTGIIVCAFGVSLMFHTYISPEVYELFVKELSAGYNVNISRFKTAYDCISCLIGIVLSFLLFGLGHFEGVKAGTVICALVNGPLIGMFSKLSERRWEFTDALPLRRYFE